MLITRAGLGGCPAGFALRTFPEEGARRSRTHLSYRVIQIARLQAPI